MTCSWTTDLLQKEESLLFPEKYVLIRSTQTNLLSLHQPYINLFISSHLISFLFYYIFFQEYNFDNGVVQLIYEKLAVKRYRGIPLKVFWDKKCLNYGQDWEQGFFQGLITSQVIILLMSNRVWEFYFSRWKKLQIIFKGNGRNCFKCSLSTR